MNHEVSLQQPLMSVNDEGDNGDLVDAVECFAGALGEDYGTRLTSETLEAYQFVDDVREKEADVWYVNFWRREGPRDANICTAIASINDALKGWDLPWKESQLELYILYTSSKVVWLRYIIHALNLLTALHNPQQIFDMIDITEIIVAVFYVIDLVLQIKIIGHKRFFQSNWRTFHCIAVGIFAVALISFDLPSNHSMEIWYRSIHLVTRSWVCMVYFNTLQRVFEMMAKTFYKLLTVILTMSIFLFATAVVAVMYFGKTNGGNFHSITAAMYSLAACWTTVNFPDVMLPGYINPYVMTVNQSDIARNETNFSFNISYHFAKNPAYPDLNKSLSPLFFIPFMVSTTIFVFAIIFTVIYENYRTLLKQHVIREYTLRQRKLKCAWCALTSEVQNTIDINGWMALFDEFRPDWPKDVVLAQFAALNVSGTRKLSYNEFLGLYHLLNLNIQRIKDTTQTLHVDQRGCLGRIWSALVDVLTHPRTTDFFIVASIIAIAVHFQVLDHLHIPARSHRDIWHVLWIVQLALGVPFDLDVILKVTYMGWGKYSGLKWNRFDAVSFILNLQIYLCLAVGSLISGPYVAMVEILTLNFGEGANETPDLGKILCSIRLIRGIKLFSRSERCRKVTKTFQNVMPLFGPYLIVLFGLLWQFAIIGMNLFEDKWLEIDPRTAFGRAGYYGLNYQTSYNAMVTTFHLMMVNNWNITIEGYGSAVGWPAYLYFLLFYIIVVMFSMNIMVALCVEIFLSQLSLNRDGMLRLDKHQYARRVQNELTCIDCPGWRWKISYKTYSYRVQTALERLHVKASNVLPMMRQKKKNRNSRKESCATLRSVGQTSNTHGTALNLRSLGISSEQHFRSTTTIYTSAAGSDDFYDSE